MLSRLWYHLSYTVLSFQCNVKIFTKHLVVCIFTAYSWNHRCVRMSGSKLTSGAPNGKFWGKRPQNNNKVWIKLSEVIFSILGDCWKKCICSSLPSAQQDWRKSSQPTRCTYNLQPDLLGGWGRKLGGPKGRFLTNKTYQLFYLNPELPFSQQHFPSKDMSFLPHLPDSKHFPEEQIFRGKDPLAASVTWY